MWNSWAYLGNELSPDYESDNFNVLLGSASGAGLCALGGYHLGNVLYTSDPKNMEYEPIEFNKKQKSNAQVEINTGLDLSLSDLKFSGKEYANIPLIKKLPKSLKNKIKKQKIIKYQVEPQVIKTKNGRLLYFSGGEAIEHQYAQ